MKQWLLEKWKTILVIVSAVAIALLGRKATKLRAEVKGKESVATDLLNSGISKKLEKGKKLIEEADKAKNKGVAVRAKLEEHLEKIGGNDETIDDIAHRFNSRRLRHDSANTHS